MPIPKHRRAEYHQRYDKIHRKHSNKLQRIRRAKAKLLKEVENAIFDYEMGILPIRTENFFKEMKNEQKV